VRAEESVVTATATAALAIALAGSFLLLWSALGHVRAFDLLRATIVKHDVVPYRRHRQIALALVVAELTIGGLVTASWLVSGAPLVLGLAGQAVLYTIFCGYAALVLRSKRSVACGCFGGESITWVIPVRAAAVAAATTVAAVAVPPGASSAAVAALALGAALVLRYLPRIVRTPEGTHAT